MNIEEAVLQNKKFLESLREKYGPLGLEQIKGIIHEFIEHITGTTFADEGDAFIGILCDDNWQACEACCRVDKSEFMKHDPEEGVYFCQPCADERPRFVPEPEPPPAPAPKKRARKSRKKS